MTRPEMPTPCTKQSFQKSVVSVEVIGHCAMPNCGVPRAHRRVQNVRRAALACGAHRRFR